MSNKDSSKENPLKKLKTTGIALSEYVQSHIFEKENELREKYVGSKPYSHGLFESVFREDFLRKVKDEIKKTSKVTFKESDLFRVYQSIDMANLSDKDHSDTLPTVLELRRILYSDAWRSLIERMCGLEHGTLTGKVDCACNCHAPGCHLLCHDDVIGTRKISYIIYLTELDWTEKEGGALELYDRSISKEDEQQSDQDWPGFEEPSSIPSGLVLPIFNNMAFFTVEPGVSYHAVQEVLGDRPRLSLQGWYHAAKVPDHIESATLQQLKKEASKQESYTSFVYPDGAKVTPELSDEDSKYLSEYLHPTYLTKDALNDICKQFEEDSSVQLRNFFRQDWVDKLDEARKQEEKATSKSAGHPDYYSQGVGGDWTLVGPAHKQRFLEYCGSPASINGTESAGSMLSHLKEKVLCSVPFQRFLARITSLGLPLGHRGHVRRFRKGLDYTVAHYGILTQQSVLDATVCFVEGSGQDLATSEVEGEAEDEPDESDIMWQSGDCGGFECYIAADESGEAADEYNQNDDTELLSVSASNNTLSLVYRDPGTMRFVKYVGSTAPSSRFDISMEYEVEDNDEEEEAEVDEHEESF
mmetsp:Transcript_14322/g.18716  ORF Transcript_14322/g.18716 Transcript_14322/m.18716 type:complete len:585 (-) Transcript_14322:135-1889(-)|eukprot:CAMPEP_0198145362 /NCGR_PEP_ID=MMETSP1443-20131203/22952_1 /TAXON_ID=186043 /ORGANISM="Entomoneis sp., Strain CCMP2396" /LENGTH=584 /DNA_ID=CAMNT_0043808983 /DNA_START=21 /DNA_END=1775 /DNA_ORIENTATION=+